MIIKMNSIPRIQTGPILALSRGRGKKDILPPFSPHKPEINILLGGVFTNKFVKN